MRLCCLICADVRCSQSVVLFALVPVSLSHLVYATFALVGGRTGVALCACVFFDPCALSAPRLAPLVDRKVSCRVRVFHSFVHLVRFCFIHSRFAFSIPV